MTQAEWDRVKECEGLWLGARDPRRHRLFVAACCRRLWDLLTPLGRAAVEAAERFADGEVGEAELARFLRRPDPGFAPRPPAEADPSGRGRWAAAYTSHAVGALLDLPHDRCHECGAEMTGAFSLKGVIYDCPECPGGVSRWPLGRGPEFACRAAHELDPERPEGTAQFALARDIFGRSAIRFSAQWRTRTVLTLARGMYESRDFGAMPVLADALQDDGCDNEELLRHCREPGEHVRGCWAVDRVLGRWHDPGVA